MFLIDNNFLIQSSCLGSPQSVLFSPLFCCCTHNKCFKSVYLLAGCSIATTGIRTWKHSTDRSRNTYSPDYSPTPSKKYVVDFHLVARHKANTYSAALFGIPSRDDLIDWFEGNSEVLHCFRDSYHLSEAFYLFVSIPYIDKPVECTVDSGPDRNIEVWIRISFKSAVWARIQHWGLTSEPGKNLNANGRK
jgi:hypothetical protein